MSKTIEVTLYRPSFDMLKGTLSSKWSEDLQQIVRVGNFLEGISDLDVPKAPALPAEGSEASVIEAFNAAYKVWADEKVVITVPEKVYQDTKACLKHYAAAKAFAINKYVVNLLTEFGADGGK